MFCPPMPLRPRPSTWIPEPEAEETWIPEPEAEETLTIAGRTWIPEALPHQQEELGLQMMNPALANKLQGTPKKGKQPKKSKDQQSKQSKDPKTKQSKQPKDPKTQTKKRLTKKEQDQAAVQKFLSSPAYDEATVQKVLSDQRFNGFLDARVTMEVEKQLDKKKRSDRFDKVYKRAQKVLKQFASLADGDPEVYKEEGDLLLEYMGKMTELQCRRKGLFESAERQAGLNASFSRLKHKRN